MPWIVEKHTKNILRARLLLASVFFFPSVMSLSASRWASLALGYVVDIDSCLKRDVTRLRRRACLCEDVRPRCRYFNLAPAMSKGEEVNKNSSQLGKSSAKAELSFKLARSLDKSPIDRFWTLWELHGRFARNLRLTMNLMGMMKPHPVEDRDTAS
jgi:hypothetical protein